MKVTLTKYDGGARGSCVVVLEEGDKKQYTDSAYFHHIKKALNEQNPKNNVIKKRMYKDGHMVSDDQQYIRTRNLKSPESFCVFWNRHAIAPFYKELNDNGEVVLSVEYNLYMA